jgi:perosamine synthetase
MDKPAILGGKPLFEYEIPTRTCIGSEEKSAVNDVLDSGELSSFLGAPGKYFNGGKYVKRFEKNFSETINAKHAISVNSWTSGLMTIMGAIGISPGDEIICSPYTMSASATCALFYGGVPIFADIERDSYCLDPISIEKLITPKTKAIIVVHLFGGVANMESIMLIADKHGLVVVEDAAQAPGVTYKEKSVGLHGHIGGFSLNYHKHIHAGEGGVIVTNNDKYALRCRMIRNHGENYVDMNPKLPIDNTIGGNYRLTEIQAAIAIEQLKKLTNILAYRNILAKHLTDGIKSIHGLEGAVVRNNSNHSWYLYPIKFNAKEIGMSRDVFVEAVNAEFKDPKCMEQVILTYGYLRPLYLSRVYQEKIAIGDKGFPFNYSGKKYYYPKGLCKVAEDCYEDSLILTSIVREPITIKIVNDLVKAMKKVILFNNEIMSKSGSISNASVSTIEYLGKI